MGQLLETRQNGSLNENISLNRTRALFAECEGCREQMKCPVLSASIHPASIRHGHPTQTKTGYIIAQQYEKQAAWVPSVGRRKTEESSARLKTQRLIDNNAAICFFGLFSSRAGDCSSAFAATGEGS